MAKWVRVSSRAAQHENPAGLVDYDTLVDIPIRSVPRVAPCLPCTPPILTLRWSIWFASAIPTGGKPPPLVLLPPCAPSWPSKTPEPWGQPRTPTVRPCCSSPACGETPPTRPACWLRWIGSRNPQPPEPLGLRYRQSSPPIQMPWPAVTGKPAVIDGSTSPPAIHPGMGFISTKPLRSVATCGAGLTTKPPTWL